MSNGTLKILAAAAALYYLVLRGARALIVEVGNYSVHSVDLLNERITLRINFLINNPLLVGITLKGIDGDIYVQGVRTGRVNMKYDYYLSGRHAHSIPVLVELSTSQMTDAIIANIKTGNINTLTIAFDGGIIVSDSLVRIPVNKVLTWSDIMG